VYPALLPLMRTPRLPDVDCTDAPADLNGLARFAERINLVSARVTSHLKRSLPNDSVEWAALLPKCESCDSNPSPERDSHVRRSPVIFFSTFTQIPLWMVIYFVLFHESLRPVSTDKYVPVVFTVAVTTTWRSLRVVRAATLAEWPPGNSVEIGAPS